MQTPVVLVALAMSQAWGQSYTYTAFDPPGSVSTTVTGINNSGQIVGTYIQAPGGMPHSFIRQADGVTYTVFDEPDAAPGSTIASTINNLGQAAGRYKDATGTTHAFIRSADGTSFTSFDLPGAFSNGFPANSPTGINDVGEIVGMAFDEANVAYGFLRSADGSTYTTINFPRADFTTPQAINNNGQIVGMYHLGGSASLKHGFILSRDGTYTSFEVPGFVQGSQPTSVNNLGQILSGPYVVNANGGSFALAPGYNLAQSINDGGVVAGVTYSNSATRGFVAVPVTAGAAGPAIRSLAGIESASEFGGDSALAPGSWIEIYGSNLSPTSRQWQNSDFQGDTAPTSLNGVSVSINGQPAFISYISPGQVNAQAPSTLTPGPAVVTVTSGGQTSGPYATTVNAVEPGLLEIAADSYYAGAAFTDFTTYVLPPGLTPAVPSRPAQPGDTIVFLGVGFGPVNPEIPAGQITSGVNALQGNVQVSLGGVPAQVTYAGLMPGTVGLYQFNVVVPNVPSTGTAVPVQFTLNGVLLPQTPTNDPAAPQLLIAIVQ